MSRERVSYFLKILQKEQLIIRIKPKGKMPYYEANRTSSTFRSEKRWYGLAMIAHSGLLEHLSQLPEIKTAILFFSFSPRDWSASSDIDLFLYGRDANFEKGKFEHKLNREIQVFSYENQKSIKRELDPNVIPNIARGFNIKESIEPFEVILHA